MVLSGFKYRGSPRLEPKRRGSCIKPCFLEVTLEKKLQLCQQEKFESDGSDGCAKMTEACRSTFPEGFGGYYSERG